MDADSWRALARGAREYAERCLGVDQMVEAYENLFMSLTAQQAVAPKSAHGN
jgi:hypothetical protein